MAFTLLRSDSQIENKRYSVSCQWYRFRPGTYTTYPSVYYSCRVPISNGTIKALNLKPAADKAVCAASTSNCVPNCLSNDLADRLSHGKLTDEIPPGVYSGRSLPLYNFASCSDDTLKMLLRGCLR